LTLDLDERPPLLPPLLLLDDDDDDDDDAALDLDLAAAAEAAAADAPPLSLHQVFSMYFFRIHDRKCFKSLLCVGACIRSLRRYLAR